MSISVMIVQCPKGHRRRQELTLPMALEAYSRALLDASVCQTCQTPGCVLLTGQAYREARAELEGQPCA